MTSLGRLGVLKYNATIGKIFVVLLGPVVANLFTLVTPWVESSASSSSSELFGGTLYITPLTSCSDLHNEHEISYLFTRFKWRRVSFCLFVVGKMYSSPRCVHLVLGLTCPIWSMSPEMSSFFFGEIHCSERVGFAD